MQNKKEKNNRKNDSKGHYWKSNAHLRDVLFTYIKKGTIIQKTYGGVEEISSDMNIFSVTFSLFL